MKQQEKGYTLASILDVNKYVLKSCPGKYIAYILINIIKVVQILVSLEATQFTTNAVYRLYSRTSAGIQVELKNFLLFSVALAGLHIVSVIGDILLKGINLDVSLSFERELNTKLSKVKWDYYENYDTAVKLHEVRSKSLAAMLSIIESSMFYFRAFLSVFAYGFFLSQINIFVVIVYLLLIVLSSKLADKVFEQVRTIWEDIQPLNQKQTYFFGISGDKIGHQEYRFNRLFPFVRDKWEKYFDEEYKLRIKIFQKYEVTLQTARIILNLPYVLMLIYVSYEIVIGRHEIGFLMLCREMFNNIVNTFGSVQGYISHDKVEAGFIRSFFNMLKLQEEPELNALSSGVENIEFKEIEFSYPQAKIKALMGLNLTIKKGEKLAIVGHNGSGKTTFTNVLMAMTESFEGEILLGSEKAECFSRLRNNIACILQDFAQYQMTIKENIQMGNIERELMDEEVIELLRKVGLKDYICSLPEGINTKMGELEKGIELSKGQWQRIAIARLLAKETATVWILDEPTAYLDPISEIEIYDLIYSLAGDRTVIFISHRLGFAKKADRIVVFNSGRIIEEGTHNELLHLDKEYAQMYKNQEAWYAA